MTEEKCQYCNKPGKMYDSPWGIPATISVCKFHLWILPFWPMLRFSTIAVILIIIVIISYIFF